MTDLTDVLAAVIRGDRQAAAILGAAQPNEVLSAADAHGVLPLVASRLDGWELPGEPLWSTMGREYRRRAARDLLRERDLRMCLARLSDHGIPVLLMKGAELAYTHYERPDLRTRVDTDLLVPADSRERVRDVLLSGGYEWPGQFPGGLVMYQEPYTKRLGGQIVHVIDIHWRIANPQVFGAILSFDELAGAAVPVSELGPAARGLSPTHALLLACVHRVAHHFNSDSLIWFYDIHLLASRLDEAEWAQFVELARQRGIAAVCAEGLQRTVHYFPTAIPQSVTVALREGQASTADKTTAAYLEPRRHVQNVIADLRALPKWSTRLRLVKEHLLPSSEYMRGTYAPLSHAPLPLLYVQRAMRGARKWLGRVQ
jgi:Uncharacterised nucleotidyltransferase